MWLGLRLRIDNRSVPLLDEEEEAGEGEEDERERESKEQNIFLLSLCANAVRPR